jgi:hypothetical protein
MTHRNDMKLATFAQWLLLVILPLLSGCTSAYNFRVDALASPAAASLDNKTYVFRSGDPSIAADDLRFMETTMMVERALAERGYRRAAKEADATLLIFVEARMSGPLAATETWSDPVYLRSAGYSHVVRTPVYGADGKVTSYVSSRVYIPPQTEFAGYVNRQRQITVFEKGLYLSARLRKEDGAAGSELWTLSVITQDQSSDLRGYLPYLLAAAHPYIGQRTEGQVIVSIKDNESNRRFGVQVGVGVGIRL